MSLKDILHLPKLADIAEFGRTEFPNGIADIRSALIDEAWFGQSRSSVTQVDRPSLGWELRDDDRAAHRGEDPFGSRWSAEDEKRQRADHDHPQELDFDR